MVSRYDAVLVAIPLLAVGGAALGRSLRFTAATLGVGGRLAAVPFAALGVAAALVVIARELLVVGHPAE
jgi:hypothetical protein